MFGRKKRKVQTWRSIINGFLGLILVSCTSQTTEVKQETSIKFWGETQGTTYSVIIVDSTSSLTQHQLDSILHDFDMSLSTYKPESLISKFNASEKGITIAKTDPYFFRCYDLSMDVFLGSKGAFDPSVFPLVEGWGFMKNMEHPLTKTEVEQILKVVSYKEGVNHKKIDLGDSIQLQKLNPAFKLDYNAIAQGLSVDVLMEYISSKGHKNVYVEIGGELKVTGKNPEGENWRIGIDTPQPDEAKNGVRTISEIVALSNKSIATSGNYRKYYEVDGKKYAHTLNPKTGFPVQHNLLSATVITDDCARADAFATVFMVLGVEESKKLLTHLPDLEVIFIYADGEELKTYTSPGANKLMFH